MWTHGRRVSYLQADPAFGDTVRTQVAIIGAGPSGLLLGQLLDRVGNDAVVLECRTARRMLGRIRAGVLERRTVEVLPLTDIANRLHSESLIRVGVELSAHGKHIRPMLYPNA
jgi:p-hydroxybenzoate 3-monooxygenase